MDLNNHYGDSDTAKEIYTELASGDKRADRIYDTLEHGTGELADNTTPSAKKCKPLLLWCILVNSILIGLLIIAVSVSLYMCINVPKASNSKVYSLSADLQKLVTNLSKKIDKLEHAQGQIQTEILQNLTNRLNQTIYSLSADLQKLVTNLSQNIDKLEHAQGQIQTEILQNLTNRLNETIDGGWTEWNPWGQCPVLCGVGLQSRTRSCTNPSPANAGQQCVGQNFDVKLCYRGFCEDDDCYAIKMRRGKLPSGIYDVLLWNTSRVIPVYCDFDTDTGGWTVFQYRFNGSVDFYRNFSDYERGFGSLDGEFWLGLENIYEMVSRGKSELRLDLTAADGKTVYETFQNFSLGERPYYTLHIDKGVGTAGDSDGLSYNNGRHFSTFDMDRDVSSRNCAVDRHGGWWYSDCTWANLNGEYVTPGTIRPVQPWGGMVFYSFKHKESLKVSRMMFRRV